MNQDSAELTTWTFLLSDDPAIKFTQNVGPVVSSVVLRRQCQQLGCDER